MPGIAECIPVQAAVKASLSQSKKLDHDIASSPQQILLHHIDFKAAEKCHLLEQKILKSKYVLLRNTFAPSTVKKECDAFCVLAKSNPGNIYNSTMNAPGPSGDAGNGDGLPYPRVILYPPERVKLEWHNVNHVGRGLVNIASTCFMNSALQCLTHTAPVVNFVYSREHSCVDQQRCMMCVFSQHVRLAFNNGCAFRPDPIFRRLPIIAKHFKPGRQEDAHEFLRHFLESLRISCLNGTKLDAHSKETTVINQIFGGFLRSQVQCMKCSWQLNTYDRFMDLSLDIKGQHSVEGALAKFTRPETLSLDNAYMCERCKNKVQARKRLSIHRPPNVITIQLKRFAFSFHATGKLDDFVSFPEMLDMRPYLSQSQGESVHYRLYSVLIHRGSNCCSGHYYSYVKSASNTWYRMDDSTVHTVPSHIVFNAEAYILFYARMNSPSTSSKQSECSSQQTELSSIENGFLKQKAKGMLPRQSINVSRHNCIITGRHNDIGVQVPRQMPPAVTTSPSLLPITSPDKTSSLQKQKMAVSLAVKHRTPMHGNPLSTVCKKPRILLSIKQGKVAHWSDRQPKSLSSANDSLPTLVPYEDNSDSGEDRVLSKVVASVATNGATLDSNTTAKDVNVIDRTANSPVEEVSVVDHCTLSSNVPLSNKDGQCSNGDHRQDADCRTVDCSAVTHAACIPCVHFNSHNDNSSVDTTSQCKCSRNLCSVPNTDSLQNPSLISSSNQTINDTVNSTSDWLLCHQATPGDSDYLPISSKQSPTFLSYKQKCLSNDSTNGHFRTEPTYCNGMKLFSGIGAVSTNDDAQCDGVPTKASHHTKCGNPVSGNELSVSGFHKKIKTSTIMEVSSVLLKTCSTPLNIETVSVIDRQTMPTTAIILSTSCSVFDNGRDGSLLNVDINCPSPSDSTRKEYTKKKTKKVKKKLKRHLEDVAVATDFGEVSNAECGVHRKKNICHHLSNDSCMLNRMLKHCHSESDSEYMWEERTKESFFKETADVTSVKQVPTVVWNDTLHDDLGKAKPGILEVHRFDADLDRLDGSSCKSAIAQQLKQRASALTWSGDVMFNDPEVCKQEATHINVWDKLYNEDLDRGRVKKVKRKCASSHHERCNLFQVYQNENTARKYAQYAMVVSTGRDSITHTCSHSWLTVGCDAGKAKVSPEGICGRLPPPPPIPTLRLTSTRSIGLTAQSSSIIPAVTDTSTGKSRPPFTIHMTNSS